MNISSQPSVIPEVTTAHTFKRPLRLPTSTEEWAEADHLLSASVLQAPTAEEKNLCLCSAVYDVMADRFETRSAPCTRRQQSQPRVKQHDRALKKVTQLKNEARQALHKAKRQGDSTSSIHTLAANFLSLLRTHSHLKRKSSQRLRHQEAKVVREDCHRDFWGFAKRLLGEGATTQTTPTFSASSAHSFFSEVYNSSPHHFTVPPWMPVPPPPGSGYVMEMSPVSERELAQVLKKSRSSSSPSPFDRIPHTIFKKCPSLHPALLDLFNRVIMEGSVPSSWKAASVKLIPKGSAQDDPSSPSNFRPIALTPTVSKLLSGILRDRWLRHIKLNGYLNSNLQKAFLPTIPGVSEYQAKLAAVIESAKKLKRSLAIAWLDIANAYGSVHHSLIQFSLAHYHAPPEFCMLMKSWYSDLSATISSGEWSTAPVPLKIGVYQGDPLSVVIFLTVMNTLSDTLCTRGDLGFSLPHLSISVNNLLYADDACIISNSPAGCQHLLDLVQHWLEWAQLRAKVPKCRSMVVQASTGRRVKPALSIGGESIPTVEDDTFKFLGMPVRFYKNNISARESLKLSLQRMLASIDETPLTRQQKLRLFKFGVCPRLSWPFLIENLPISWLEQDLQPLATKVLKRWAGLAKSACTSILFLPVKRGGLALPSLVGLYRKQQASRMVQLFISSDPGVRKAADLKLDDERKRLRAKFRPAMLIDDLRSADHAQSRRALSGAAKTMISEEEANQNYLHLSQLPAQGEMARSWGDTSPELWVKAVQGLPPDVMKFSINAAIDTLPTNANLHLWGKKDSDMSRGQTVTPACP